MKFQLASLAGLLMAGQTIAAPVQARDGVKMASDYILEIAPKSATCDNTDECRTNVQAGPLFADAMLKYNVKNAAQIAGILALTAFESDDYKYKHNISPGRPGQGTSNMQQWPFTLKYAQSIPELKDKLSGVTESVDDNKKNEILALVTPDEYNFGSGPWFFTTQCSTDIQEALKAGTDAGFQQYMSCVGITDVTPDRLEYWNRAKTAFNLSG
ncbi:uncharacterized protein F4822DRAFT_328525 [Hypoxylon trugodes]|uniref:uncharacterized protein n=1 Tax=Hypoxylon trugodes TaxID=326681 RepID=UPI00219E263D|nr:uncharacterized protein F4822DRAFT_328525 [Hypoxylon trugodes]KAI1386868.1 hypothetical protein F4822DRAFT_328525 [Hypoxylon trugodes]